MEVADALRKVGQLSTELLKYGKGISSICEEIDVDADSGISLLQAKSATLMRYNYNLARLAMARVQGKSIESIAEKLVQDWVALEKIRPIEKKLRYQIDALLKLDSTRGAAGGKSDADRHRPDPSAVVIDEDEEEVADDGMYRPPRISEVVYDGGHTRREEREEKERQKFKARTMRSEGVREMLAEIKGKPEEIRDEDLSGIKKNSTIRNLIREENERTKFEEDNFTRLNMTKKDKKRRRDIERAMEAPALGGDEIAGIMAVVDRVKGSSKRKSAAQKDLALQREEQLKLQQLDEITESLDKAGSRGQRRRSSGSNKRRKR